MYGSPETMAAGGKSLEYYLGVNLRSTSNKTSDLLKDEAGKVIGIKGSIRNTKNKVSVPFRECDFELMYDEGLNPLTGLLPLLEQDGLVTRSGAWYTVAASDKKFQSKEFPELLKSDAGFKHIRDLLKISG